MLKKNLRWMIFGCTVFFSPLKAEALVSANFLLFDSSVNGVTTERLEALSELITVTTIYIPIFEEDHGQYDKTKDLLDQFSFNVITTTPMSADKDITSLDEKIGNAGVQFLKERILITKKLGGKVLTGALLFPELKGSMGEPIRPLDLYGNQIEPPVLTTLINQRLRIAVARMQEVADFASIYGITIANEYINHS